jgi:hypothetical protein
MTPVKLLEGRLRSLRRGRLVPIQEGISPTNMLFPRSRVIRILQVSMTDGKFPEKLLLAAWSE